MSEEFGLKRVLGLGDLVAIEIGTTVGAGIFSLTALAAKQTGPSVPLAFVAAAAPIFLAMMTVGMLGAALPTVGGTYRYPSRLFSARWAMVGVWCYALGMVFGAFPMYATECVRYVKAVWPGVPVRPAAVGLLTVFFLLNVFGISVAAGAQAVMVAVLVAALLVFGVGGAPTIEASRFEPLFTNGVGGFVVAAAILTFALQGANSVIELGAEIKKPHRNIPLSLSISVPIVTVIYILVAVSALGNIDLSEWLGSGKLANLTQPAMKFLGGSHGGWFIFFMVGGAMFAFLTTINGTFMWATKSLLVVSGDRLMPPGLAKTSRFGTPARFLTIIWLGSVLAVALDAGIEVFAAYATMGGMIIFIPAMIAAMRLPKKAPEVYGAPGFRLRGWLIYAAPGVSIGLSGLLLLILFVDLTSQKWWYPVLFAGWFVLGFVFFEVRKRSVERETGRPFQEMVDKDLQKMIAGSLAGGNYLESEQSNG